LLKNADAPIVVDLGFGASPITAIELLERCKQVNRNTTVVGIEIERERVERGLAVAHKHLQFQLGGFEVPLPASFAKETKVDAIRAFNVLRQYSEAEVAAAWHLMQSRLTLNGLLIEGTCDEIGRLASWVTLDSEKPLWFTISLKLSSLEAPSKVQERLPKALIHHNVPGEKINDFLSALDAAWAKQAPLSTFSAQQRWVAVCRSMQQQNWPIRIEPKRWRLGEISVEWNAVAPKTF
jgi:hypothetical protein